MTPLRLGCLLVLWVLLAPAAAAAPARGDLQVTGTLRLPDGAAVDAPGLDLLWEGAGTVALAVDAEGVTVRHVGTRTVVAHTPAGDVVVEETRFDEVRSHAGATASVDAAGPGVAALRHGAPTRLALAEAELRPVEAALLAAVAAPAGMERCTGEGCLDVRGAYRWAGVGRADLVGDLTLLLNGPTLTVRDGDGTHAYSSGTATRPGAATTEYEEGWLLIQVRAARGDVTAQGAWFTPPATAATPRLEAPHARGEVVVGDVRYHARDEGVEARGDLRLDLGGVTEAPAFHPVEATYAPAFTTALSGDVGSLSLRATPVHGEGAAEAAGLAGFLVLLAGAAWYWPRVEIHLATLVSPLYSRLRRPDLLDNHVRNGIYEIVVTHPGISARAVHRLSGQSWGTVVYHLRQLERHHLVVSRTVGRTRNYYENHGKYKGMEAQLACLQSRRAAELARCILARPGMTQEDLVAVSGLPQPTTSYYVRKLRKAGLVGEERAGRYIRYAPTPDLGRFLTLRDGAPATPA